MNTIHRSRVRPLHFSNEVETLVVNRGDEDHFDLGGFVLVIPQVTELYEEMTPNSQGSRHAWKDFEHYKSVVDSSSGTPIRLPIYDVHWDLSPSYHVMYPSEVYAGYEGNASGGGTSMEFGDPGRPINGLPGLYVKRDDGGFVPPPSDLDRLLKLAMSQFLPKMKAKLSLVNSLIELKDFKSLPQSLGRIKKILQLIGSAPKGHSLKKLLNTFSKTGADSYLQLKFNIQPLVSDIVGISSSLSRSEKTIRSFLNRRGQPITSHFSYVIDEFKDSDEMTEAYFPAPTSQVEPGNIWRCRRIAVYEPTRFHAQIQYSYNYSEFQVAHAQLLALLDDLGVNLNPVIIWNAIPWSFVVDWFIRVNGWLDQFKRLNMEPEVNIRKFLWSVTRNRRIYLYLINSSGIARPRCTYGQTKLLPIISERAYRRSCSLPGRSWFETSGMNLTKFSLGAALAISHRRSPRKKP